MTHPQSRLARGLVAGLVGLSVLFYILALVTPFDYRKLGYQFFEFVWRDAPNQTPLANFAIIALVWVNPMWFLSIICYLSKHRLGQLLFTLPGILAILLCMVFVVPRDIEDFVPAPWWWAFSMITAFFVGLLNYCTHPRPQTTDEGS
ncbi:MAG: hypothetical protein ACRC8S_00350 [Fimbriiglobus sp.]